MITLRPYQQECVDTVWDRLHDKHSVLVVAPPGAGKTECFIEICKRAPGDRRILVMLNKVLLVEQTARRMRTAGLDVGEYCGSRNEKILSKPITVATVQSLIKADFGKFNLVILDEAHRCGYREDSYYRLILMKLKQMNDRLKVVGFTATPYREEGYIYGEKNSFFDKLDFEIKIPWMIENNFLVKPLTKKPDHQFETKHLKIVRGDFDNKQLAELVNNDELVNNQIDDALCRLINRKSVIWACANINHAEAVAIGLQKRGETFEIIHSKMEKYDQGMAKVRFETGESRNLVFVTMISEGIDIPRIDALVFFRPTRSPTLAIQTIGRTLRLFQDKKDALVLDYGQVIQNVGPIDDPKIRKRGEKNKGGEAPVKICPECREIIPAATVNCPACGHEFIREVKIEKKPDESSDILHKRKILTSPVCRVEMSVYKSKSGNDCLKIDYFKKKGGFLPTVDYICSEYFIWHHDWAIRKMQRRLVELGVNFKSTLQEQAKESITRKPDFVEYEVDKYATPKRLIFTGAKNGLVPSG